MAISVGEVQATLSLRDQLTPAFQQAMQQMKVGLEGIGASARDFADKINDFIKRPLEGTTNYIHKVLDTLGDFGAGLAVVGGVTFAVGKRIFDLADAAAHLGGIINDMTEKTGMSAAAISNLKFAAEVAGGSIEQIANAMFMFQRRMGEGSDKVTEALTRLGLSFEDISNLSPDQQFLAIARGIRETEDPTKRAAAAMELFGRQGRDLLPLMNKPLDELVAKARELGFTWSHEDTIAAEHFEMATRQLRLELGKLTIDLGKDVLPLVKKFVDLASWIIENKSKFNIFENFGGIRDMGKGPMDNLMAVMQQLEEMQGTLKAPGAKLPEKFFSSTFAQATKEAEESLHKLEEARKKETEAAKKQKEAWDNLVATADELDEEVKKQIQDFLIEGKSVEDISNAYIISRASIEAVKKEMEEVHNRMEKSRDVGAAAAKAISDGFKGQPDFLKELARDMKIHSGEMTLSSRQIGGEVGIVFGTAMVTQAQEHMKRLIGPSLMESLGADLLQLPHLIVSSLTGGGGLKGAIGGVSSMLGATLGKSIGSGVKMLGKFGGPIGEAIGSLAGPLLEKLFSIGGPSKQELEGRDVEKQFEQSFGGFDKMMKAVGEVYEKTGRSASQAQADVKRLMDAEKQGGDAVKAVMADINKAFDDQKKAIEGVKNAVTGTNALADALIGPMRDAQTELDKLSAQYDKQGVSLAKLLLKSPAKNDKEAEKYGMDLASQIYDAMRKQGATESDIAGLNEKLLKIQANIQPQFEHLGQYVAATFAAQIKQGVSAFDAFTSLKPAFQGLTDGIYKFGLQSNETIDQLIRIERVVDANKEVFQSIQAVTQIYDGLSAAGLMTKELFTSFGEDIGAQFKKLTDSGSDASEVMVLMQPQLQKLWEGQQKFGFVTDETTEKLLKQAEEQGLVGENMKSVDQQILAVLKEIARALDGTRAATDQWGRSLENIPRDIDVNARVHYQRDDAVPMAAGGYGTVTQPTLFLAGEAGPEQYAFSGAHNKFGGGHDAATLQELKGLRYDLQSMADSIPRSVRDAVLLMG